MVEMDRWGLPSRPQDGRPYPAAGFRFDVIETGYIVGPNPWTFMYQGSAKKIAVGEAD
jgi:hypothetical protein